MKRILFIFIIIFKLLTLNAQRNNLPSSPCPELFQYKFNGNDWYGELELPSPKIDQREVILQVSLSLRASTNVSAFLP